MIACHHNSDTVTDANCAALDGLNQTSHVHARIDPARAKETARLAFAAYQQHVIDGDHQLASAARERFLAASAVLAEIRRGR